MIINGTSRGRSRQLAAHLLRRDENESLRLFECRGTLATDVAGALSEMEAQAASLNCKRPFYHASISSEAHTPLTEAQVRTAVDTLAEALALQNQPRIVMVHVKKGREHVHVVWSRIDHDRDRVIPDSWNYRHHEETARSLEALFGHRAIANSWSRSTRPASIPQSAARPPELDPHGREVALEVGRIWRRAADGAEFVRELRQAGYILARGDRRAFVIIDEKGKVHSLSRRLGVKTKDLQRQLSKVELPLLKAVVETRTSFLYPRAVKQAFEQAACEVVRNTRRTNTRQRDFTRPVLTAQQFAQNSSAVTTIHAPRGAVFYPPRRTTQPTQRYRSLRAALLADFGAKIDSVRRWAPADEIAAQVSALLAARDAALEALLRQEGRAGRKEKSLAGRRKLHRGVRWRRLSTFRKRRGKAKPQK